MCIFVYVNIKACTYRFKLSNVTILATRTLTDRSLRRWTQSPLARTFRWKEAVWPAPPPAAASASQT